MQYSFPGGQDPHHKYTSKDSPVSQFNDVGDVIEMAALARNALDNPGVEQYRQIRTANKVFSQRVWRHPPAQEFLTSIGWVLVRTRMIF